MTELSASDFQQFVAIEAVREPMSTLEIERRAAARKFWLRLSVGLALSGAALWSLLASGWELVAVLGALAVLTGAGIAAAMPIMAVKEGLKHPVLEEAARLAGLEYMPADFTPPVFASAKTLLFGSGGFTGTAFTDLFNGADSEGRGQAVYEACLQRSSGKSNYVVFSGQIYAIQRRPGASGYTVVVPDRKILNFWKPASDMERVRIEGDEAFEKKFEVYSTAPLEARALLFDSAFRAQLLDLRENGRVYLYAGPEEALLAVSGKDRFEPGSMLRSRPPEQRVRAMFDELCASLDILRRMKAKLG
jgi:hypothetical protein